jgi:hypothetical protein
MIWRVASRWERAMLAMFGTTLVDDRGRVIGRTWNGRFYTKI